MNDVEKLQADLTAERGRRIVAEDLLRQAKIDATYWEGRARRADRVWPKLLAALERCADELERLRTVHLPRFEGKVGEPDLGVLTQARVVAKVVRGG